MSEMKASIAEVAKVIHYATSRCWDNGECPFPDCCYASEDGQKELAAANALSAAGLLARRTNYRVNLIAVDVIQRSLLVEVNGGELEPIWQIYKPEGVALVIRQALANAGLLVERNR